MIIKFLLNNILQGPKFCIYLIFYFSPSCFTVSPIIDTGSFECIKAGAQPPTIIECYLILLALVIACCTAYKLEKWMTKVIVKKNKKIRLNAVKKTVATFEKEIE